MTDYFSQTHQQVYSLVDAGDPAAMRKFASDVGIAALAVGNIACPGVDEIPAVWSDGAGSVQFTSLLARLYSHVDEWVTSVAGAEPAYAGLANSAAHALEIAQPKPVMPPPPQGYSEESLQEQIRTTRLAGNDAVTGAVEAEYLPELANLRGMRHTAATTATTLDETLRTIAAKVPPPPETPPELAEVAGPGPGYGSGGSSGSGTGAGFSPGRAGGSGAGGPGGAGGSWSGLPAGAGREALPWWSSSSASNVPGDPSAPAPWASRTASIGHDFGSPTAWNADGRNTVQTFGPSPTPWTDSGPIGGGTPRPAVPWHPGGAGSGGPWGAGGDGADWSGRGRPGGEFDPLTGEYLGGRRPGGSWDSEQWLNREGFDSAAAAAGSSAHDLEGSTGTGDSRRGESGSDGSVGGQDGAGRGTGSWMGIGAASAAGGAALWSAGRFAGGAGASGGLGGAGGPGGIGGPGGAGGIGAAAGQAGRPGFLNGSLAGAGVDQAGRISPTGAAGSGTQPGTGTGGVGGRRPAMPAGHTLGAEDSSRITWLVEDRDVFGTEPTVDGVLGGPVADPEAESQDEAVMPEPSDPR